jgi:hypothetical protein
VARSPTASESDRLVADYVREEVLYREALALGLDRDDLVVRRRLVQKMEMLALRDGPGTMVGTSTGSGDQCLWRIGPRGAR